MTTFKRIASLKIQPSDNDNRIAIVANDVTYTCNQRILYRFANGAELKAALEKFLGYSLPDIFFHKNADGTWAIATGQSPVVWPENEV